MRARILTNAVLVALVVAVTIALGAARSEAREVRPVVPTRHVPAWLTTPCAAEDSAGCYWDARYAGNGRGHSFYAVPIGRHRVAVVYWDARYGARHNHVHSR